MDQSMDLTEIDVKPVMSIDIQDDISMNNDLQPKDPLPVECPICAKVFLHKRSLQKHMAVHDGTYTCSTCYKSLSSAWALKSHEDIHTGIKYTNGCKCGVCGKSFFDVSSRNKHVKSVHMGETNFNCTYCDKGFYVKKTLDEHVRVHTGERPYVCDLCPKAFKRISDYNHHMRLHKGEVSHTCDVCGEGFRRGSELKRHVQTKHETPGHSEESSLGCFWCDKSFMTKPGLRTHVKKHHEHENISDDIRLVKQSRKMQFNFETDNLENSVLDENQQQLSIDGENTGQIIDELNMYQAATHGSIDYLNDRKSGSSNNTAQFTSLTTDTESDIIQYSNSDHANPTEHIEGNNYQRSENISDDVIKTQSNHYVFNPLLKFGKNQVMTPDVYKNALKNLNPEHTEIESKLEHQNMDQSNIDAHREGRNLDQPSEILPDNETFNEGKPRIVATENDKMNDFGKCDTDNTPVVSIKLEPIEESDDTDVGYDYDIIGVTASESSDKTQADLNILDVGDLTKSRIKREPRELEIGDVGFDEVNQGYDTDTDCDRSIEPRKKSNVKKTLNLDTAKRKKRRTIKSKPDKTKNISWICSVCDKRFLKKFNLDLHSKVEHGKNNTDGSLLTDVLKCETCDRVFVTTQALIKHMDIHTERYKCKVCDKVLHSSWSLKNHSRLHQCDSTRQWPCEMCGKNYCDKSSLNKHVKSVHLNEKHFFCEYCSLAFFARKTYDEHLRTHTGARPFVCQTCNSSFKRKSELNFHMKKHVGDGFKHKCPICGKKYMRLSQFKEHSRTHTDERPFLCHMCPKSFKHRTDLAIHKNSHTHEKVYIAECCGRQFYNKKHMTRHVQSKAQCSTDTVHICKYCLVKCDDEQKLNEHVNIVHGPIKSERQYMCVVCNKEFRQPRHLKRHAVVHTNIRKYACTECDKSFHQSAHLKDHLRTHTGERPYSCELCGKAFATAATLYNHLKNIHAKTGNIKTRVDTLIDTEAMTGMPQIIDTENLHLLKEGDLNALMHVQRIQSPGSEGYMHIQLQRPCSADIEGKEQIQLQSSGAVVSASEFSPRVQSPVYRINEVGETGTLTQVHGITDNQLCTELPGNDPGTVDYDGKILIKSGNHIKSLGAVQTLVGTSGLITTESSGVFTQIKHIDTSYRQPGNEFSVLNSETHEEEEYIENDDITARPVQDQNKMTIINFRHGYEAGEIEGLRSRQVYCDLSNNILDVND